MKKIANPTGDVRLTGQAESNGVAFKASKFLIEEFGVAFAGTLATMQGNDISCSPWDEDNHQSPVRAKIKKLAKITSIVTGILAIIFMVTYLVLVIVTEKSYWICFSLSYMMLAAMQLDEGTGIFVARILGDKEIRSFSKFLSAKNAIKNAYYDMGKVPTINEAKRYSTFSYSCPHVASRSMIKATLWLFLMLLPPLPVQWFFLGLFAVTALVWYLAKKNLLYF